MTCIAMLHYAGPPGVGGVEVTMYHHARTLAAQNRRIRVISGKGADFHPDVETIVDPLFDSLHPDVLTIKRELDQGTVTPAFDALVERMSDALTEYLAGCDVCIAHNIPTFNKNLALSTALNRYVSCHEIHLLAWCHDLAWTNPQYLPELHEAPPWDQLKQVWDNTTYVTVSEPRRDELADLLSVSTDAVKVVVPGVDPAAFFHWTPMTQMLDTHLHLLDADGLLLLPARITRRKNIGFGLRVLAALRSQSQRDFRLIITGPPGPHNPTNPGYLGELLDLRDKLSLRDAAHFLYEHGEGDTPLVPDDPTMANLYQMADALFFPSLQEGFGIPVLEAGITGLPIFCADIPPFRKTGAGDARYFDPTNGSPTEIATMIHETLANSAQYRLRVRVRHTYRWEVVVQDHLLPLIEKGSAR